MSKTLIDAQTGAVAVPVPCPVGRHDVGASICAVGLAAGETVDVMFSPDKGATWEALYADGVAVQLTDTNKIVGISSAGFYGVTKSASASPVTVAMSTPDDL